MIHPDFNYGPTLREARYTERWHQSRPRAGKPRITKVPATLKSSRFRAMQPNLTPTDVLIRTYCRNY